MLFSETNLTQMTLNGLLLKGRAQPVERSSLYNYRPSLDLLSHFSEEMLIVFKKELTRSHAIRHLCVQVEIAFSLSEQIYELTM